MSLVGVALFASLTNNSCHLQDACAKGSAAGFGSAPIEPARAASPFLRPSMNELREMTDEGSDEGQGETEAEGE